MSEKIITIEELKNIGEIIELPYFSDGTKISVKVRKPDLLTMMVDGKIPNSLLGTTINMTESGKAEIANKPNDTVDIEETKKWINFLRIVAKESLVSPTYEDFENNGITLNSVQLTEIYKYVTGEVEALKSFRNE